MERNELVKRDDERVLQRYRWRGRRSPELGIATVIGGIALLGLAALVMVALPDIKRYIKISTM